MMKSYANHKADIYHKPAWYFTLINDILLRTKKINHIWNKFLGWGLKEIKREREIISTVFNKFHQLESWMS